MSLETVLSVEGVSTPLLPSILRKLRSVTRAADPRAARSGASRHRSREFLDAPAPVLGGDRGFRRGLPYGSLYWPLPGGLPSLFEKSCAGMNSWIALRVISHGCSAGDLERLAGTPFLGRLDCLWFFLGQDDRQAAIIATLDSLPRLQPIVSIIALHDRNSLANG
jgi:hypothetical protein